MAGPGFLAIWSDIERHDLPNYLAWLTREHTGERVTTEGFVTARVFRAERSDIERFFILYDLTSPHVLDGAAYLARLNNPTPWSRRMMPKLGNFIRGGGEIVACQGHGEGSHVLALLMSQIPAEATGLLPRLAALDGVVAARIGATDIARTAVRTAEKDMRRQDASFGGVLLVEALSEEALDAASRVVKTAMPSAPAHEPVIYRQVFRNDAQKSKRAG